MELTATYIASQIVIIFVYLFLSLTYCVKSRKMILAFSFISNFLNIIAFFLLGAYTSSAMCAISILRDIIFIIDQKINGKSDKISKKDIIILLFVYSICGTAIVCTYNGPLTLLYATASMLYTFSIWQKNNKLYRFLGIPVTLIVIVDSIILKSVFGAILQGVVLITSMVGFFSQTENKDKLTKVENNIKMEAA